MKYFLKFLVAGICGVAIVASSGSSNAYAQAADGDTLMHGELEPIVITATRTPHELEDVPIPTDVVSAREIEARGAARLPDLLAEQTGLMLQHDHGVGIQMQGLGPEYTTILLDGLPLIGRTAGTLDLNRITLGNVERIEIIRGPSSSLYGSQALAGVVNIITARPDSSFEGFVRTRYGTHSTADASAYIGRHSGGYSASIFLNRFSSGGYDLDAASLAPTSPSFSDYTVQTRVQARPTVSTTIHLTGRGNLQSQSMPLALDVNGAQQTMRDRSNHFDWNLSPSIMQLIGDDFLLNGRLYASRFTTSNEVLFRDSGAEYSAADYAQFYGEGEAMIEGALGLRHQALAGVGYIQESVQADRVEGARRTFYAFAQDEWRPARYLDLVVSARLDAPSDYATRVSPKLAALVRPADDWHLRLSVGSGYKAPAFRQLYLSFTNPTVGYSVLGATEVLSGLQRMQQEGQIAEIFETGADSEPLSSETSVAFNAELSYRPSPGVRYKIGAFRNNVNNLIETKPIAVKTNGQHVFSYFNISRVYTQGLEAEMEIRPLRALSVRIGYQLLVAQDRNVLERIDDGALFTRENERDRRMTRADYGGLMQRSRHQGSIQILYDIERIGLTAMLTSRYRGRFGFTDLNGNGVLDVDAEYVDGYAISTLSVSKDLNSITVGAGVENFTGVTRPAYVPSLSGRRWFASIEYRL